MLGEEMIADMHTHCEYSHDSTVKMEDMYLAQVKKGNGIFAVTDHFDTGFYRDIDIFSPLKASNEMANKLNLLTGVEIGEGFWYPEQSAKALTLCDYDVVLGSVHLIKYRNQIYEFSKTDFSLWEKSAIEECVDVYFDDMITMIDNLDFDVLAHMTLPWRYIVGVCHMELGMSRYHQKIDIILDKIIRKGIALEMNTSSYEMLGDFMPSKNILQRYYDKGGYLITLGSDAHKAEQVSQYFDEAIKLIKQIGFKHIYYYKKRKPICC